MYWIVCNEEETKFLEGVRSIDKYSYKYSIGHVLVSFKITDSHIFNFIEEAEKYRDKINKEQFGSAIGFTGIWKIKQLENYTKLYTSADTIKRFTESYREFHKEFYKNKR